MKTIAIRIANPATTARQFGECAGDFSAGECQWWVGTPKCLHPSARVPKGATIVVAPVVYCGGDAWIQHRASRRAPVTRPRNSYLAMVAGFRGLVATGHVVREHRFGGLPAARVALGKLRVAPAPVLP